MNQYEIYIKSDSRDYIVVKSGNYQEIQLEWEEDSERRPDKYIGSFKSLESPSFVENSYDSNDTVSLYENLARCKAYGFSKELIEDLKGWNDDNVEGWREYLKEKWKGSSIHKCFFSISLSRGIFKSRYTLEPYSRGGEICYRIIESESGDYYVGSNHKIVGDNFSSNDEAIKMLYELKKEEEG